MSDNCPEEIELHRPYIDAVTLRCPECGGTMTRVKEVIDCWFDSGAMPFAQWHYPFENKEIFEENFPADFISEAVDQTRGWFYSLMAISTLIFDETPYKNVIVLGLVQDENGQKMSKSKGNAVDPFEALETYGADAIRWYFYSNSAPWLPNKFYAKAVTEGQRKFLGTLWNTYAFYVLYANIDAFDPTKYALEYDRLSVMDKWIISRLNTVVKTADSYLENYKITETAKLLQDFVDELSNWYVRRSRERFWVKGMPQDKINAYMTLYTVLTTFVKICAPMIPFMADDIYRNLVCSVDPTAPESVHLCDFPTAEESRIDTALEEEMELVLEIVVLGRAARNNANLKNRQPLRRMLVKADRPLDAFYAEIAAEELNVKEIEFTQDVSAFTSYSFKPQLKTLGPKYGKDLGKIRALLSELDGAAAMRELEESGTLVLDLGEKEAVLEKEDLLIDTAQKEGFETAADRGVTVVLETTLTPELIEEGFVRELISRIQTMRKEAGYEVLDHIVVYQAGSQEIKNYMMRNEPEIRAEVLAESVCYGEEFIPSDAYRKDWNINGFDTALAVRKIG